jgi:DNA-binding response OmpR family regulator
MNACKKILIADDERTNLDFFELMLSRLGFVVEEANDGIEALEKARRFMPDLILLDNLMPGMTGWEVTRTLKGDPKYSGIPIIMLSALGDVKDKVEGFELGVDDYITKPFNFSEVLARIRAVLRNRELFTQIAVRESRLSMAEELNKDMKDNLQNFVKSIDDLDAAIALFSQNGGVESLQRAHAPGSSLSGFVDLITEKTQRVRKHIAELDARIEKTIREWEELKKSEIGLSALETQIRKYLHTEEGHGGNGNAKG